MGCCIEGFSFVFPLCFMAAGLNSGGSAGWCHLFGLGKNSE